MEDVASNDRIQAINIIKNTSSAFSINNFRDCISTLPINLCFRRSNEAERKYGIWSLREIPKSITFGPYEGIYVHNSECHETAGFQWKVKRKGNDVVILDGSKKKGSNWLRYVNYASSKSEQNLVAIQRQSAIYYITYKLIPIDTELLVWYDISSQEGKSSEYNNGNLLKLGKCCFVKNQNLSSNIEVANTACLLDDETIKRNRNIIQGATFVYNTNEETTDIEHKITERGQEIRENHDQFKNGQENYCKLRNYQKHTNKIQGENTLYSGLRSPNKDHIGRKNFECVKKFVCEKKFNQQGNLLKHRKIHDNDDCYERNLSTRKFPGIEHHEQIRSKMEQECSECEKNLIYPYQHNLDHRIPSEKNPYEYTICGKKFSRKSSTKEHVPAHASEKHFKLNTSRRGFICSTSLNIHKRNNIGEKTFDCNICYKKFSYASNLKIHKRIHTGEKPFECNICNKKFTRLSYLNVHKRIHSGERPFECNICNKKFTQLSYLNAHKRIHTGEKPFECNICNKKFTRLSSLSLHKRIHAGENPFECNICNKTFTQLSSLNRHKTIHIGEKPFECNICDKKFTRLSSLNLHKRIHTGENPFECNTCNKKFTRLFSLSLHKRIHTGEKPFECKICSKKFTRLSSLSLHKGIHTGEKPFECNICDKKFTRLSSLNRHKTIHTGEKPFECNICDKKFTRLSSLNVHRRIHTGEKPFECNTCNKKFRNSHDMSVHKRIHTGEMPFECIVCNIKYKHRSSLKWHNRIHK